MIVRQPGELRRVAARFTVGQVWRRRDGVCYRLVNRMPSGWSVHVDRGIAAASRKVAAEQLWSFTDRHLHNLVCTNRLELVPARTVVAERLRAARLPGLARLLTAYSPAQRRAADVNDLLAEEHRLLERLESAGDEERKRLAERLRIVQDGLDSTTVRTRPANQVMKPTTIVRDELSRPNNVTR